MMTTVHDLNKTVQRLRKKPGMKSSNAKAALENFEENEYEKEMPIAECVDDYNHHMGDADQADQLRSYYDTDLASSPSASVNQPSLLPRIALQS
jgi:hypothetical protein